MPATTRPLWQHRRSTRIANTGSWIYEPLLLHHGGPPHPYWPGGALVLDDDGDPRAVGLLDDLDARGAVRARQPWMALGG